MDECSFVISRQRDYIALTLGGLQFCISDSYGSAYISVSFWISSRALVFISVSSNVIDLGFPVLARGLCAGMELGIHLLYTSGIYLLCRDFWELDGVFPAWLSCN